MAKYIRILADCLGLNNALSPTKVKFDPQTGSSELTMAVNVDILDDGAIERRQGISATSITENVTSFWSGRNGTFYTSAGSLYSLSDDYTKTLLTAGLNSSADMSFCEVQDVVYAANGYQTGYIKDETWCPWVVSDYVGPYTPREFSDPPVGDYIELFNGRMYIAKDTVLWYSEPFAYSMFDVSRNFLWFEDRIVALSSVQGGLVVSTETEVLFLKGSNPNDFILEHCSLYPVIPNTLVKIKGEETFGGVKGLVLLWISQNGIYLMMPDGDCKNVTTGRLTLPTVRKGCAAFLNGRYIAFLRK